MRAFRELGRLPREIWILFASTLVNRLGTMALPFLVLYLTRSEGFSPARAGFVLAVFGLTGLAVAPVAGRLSDRFGPLRVMRASLLLSGLVMVAYPAAQSYPAILAMTVAWALTGELFRPAGLAAVSTLVEPELRKPAFALLRLAINLGMSIGPAVGGFLATVSFPRIFHVDGATSLLGAAVLFLAPWRAPSHAPPAAAPDKASPEGPAGAPTAAVPDAGHRDGRLLFFLAALIPVGMVFFQHESAMSLFLVADLGFPEKIYGLLFTLNTLLIVALEVPLNAATAHWAHRKTLTLGAILVGAGFGSYGLVPVLGGALAFVVAGTVIWTFGEMVLLPGMNAFVADLAPPERRGEYMGLYTMAFSASFALGPWAGAAALYRFGPGPLWAGCLAFGLLSAALFSRVTSAGR